MTRSCVCVCVYACVCVCLCVGTKRKKNRFLLPFHRPNTHTGWRRPIECLQLQVICRKRATNYRALLRKMTYKDKASYGSSPPCMHSTVCCFLYWCFAVPFLPSLLPKFFSGIQPYHTPKMTQTNVENTSTLCLLSFSLPIYLPFSVAFCLSPSLSISLSPLSSVFLPP